MSTTDKIISYVDVYNRANLDSDGNTLYDDHYQSVYFSQVYGTFFSVYAKFKVDPHRSTLSSNPDEPSTYHVESVKFKVANYKGILDIGIQNVRGPAEFMCDINQTLPPAKHGTIKAFVFEMRAMGGYDSGSTQPTIDYPEISLDMEFKSKDILYFRRVQKHLHSDTSRLKEGLFDDEFYFREGIDSNKFGTRKYSENDRQIPDWNDVNFGFNSGVLCPESQSFVV